MQPTQIQAVQFDHGVSAVFPREIVRQCGRAMLPQQMACVSTLSLGGAAAGCHMMRLEREALYGMTSQTIRGQHLNKQDENRVNTQNRITSMLKSQ